MKLKIYNYGKSIEFDRGYIYQVLFKLKRDTFEDWRNNIYIYKR
jgi:hypothetical protein